jgi:hypothetical protein
MFGISAFTQSPFASLASASTQFVGSLSEDIGLADTNTQTWTFLEALTEPLILNDFNSVNGSQPNGWALIDVTQTPNWAPVDDSQ